MPPPPLYRPALRQTRVGGPQLLQLAARAERQGDLLLAERGYIALTNDRQRGVRNEARFRLARLRVAGSDLAGGARLLRQILDEEPGTARVRLELATILEKLGDESSARRELRAAQASRPPALLARLIDRYAASLRDRRPFGAEFKVALAPDSNINRATTADRLDTVIGEFDIEEDSDAKSGLGLNIEGSAFARVALGGSAAMIVQAGGRALRYKDASFNRMTLAGRAGVQVEVNGSQLSLNLAGQQHRLGGRAALVSRGIEVGWSRPISRRTHLRLDGGRALLNNRFNRLEDARLTTVGASIDHALSPRAGLSFSLSGARKSARDAAYSTLSIDTQAGGWREVGPLTLALSVGLGRLRADERLAILPAARRDRSMAISAGITSRKLNWRGLAPSIRLQFERVHSNIAIFEMRRRTVEIGFIRAF